MKHSYRGALERDICLICGYNEPAHTSLAVCEACGLAGECDFYPDVKHPKKILLCAVCFDKETKVVAIYNVKKPTVVYDDNVTTVYQVRTSGDYFNANIPAVTDIQKAIEADETIEADKKKYEEAKQVKVRIAHLAKVLFELDKERSTLANEQRETQVYFNHLMKELSAEKQRELGTIDITYKQEKAPKKVSAPSIKRFDKAALRDAASKHSIPEYMLQGIITSRKVSIDEAVKVYHEVMTAKKG